MFEAAAGFGQQIEKDVSRIRDDAPQPVMLGDDFLEVARCSIAIPDVTFADADQQVLAVANLERIDVGVAAQDR